MFLYLARRLFTHISTDVYRQVLIYTAEWTGASWREWKWSHSTIMVSAQCMLHGEGCKVSLPGAIINSTKYSNIPDQMAFQLIGKPHQHVWFYLRNHDVRLCTRWRCYISVGVSHVILNVKTGWYLMVASRFMSVIRRSHKKFVLVWVRSQVACCTHKVARLISCANHSAPNDEGMFPDCYT